MCVSPDLLTANNVLFLLSKREHLFSFIRLIPFTPKIGFPRLFLFVTMLCVGGFASFGQQKIKGIITGTNGQPLSGVSVSVKGTARGAISDEEGIFKIAANNGEVLIFSSIGYNSQQVTVKEDTLLRLSLTEFISDLDQIVVTGYASEKVKAISGSVAIVKPKELLEIPAGQVEQMLQGKVAGLNVITSGEPGSASIVRLHGIGNFGDVTPLYIIDGVQGDINSINPYDIESLQVLKDAGSYAIYGVRGANGVIVITTKQGKKGKTSISYDGYLGWQEPLNTGFNYLNPQEQADLEWMAFKNSGQSPSDPLYGSGAGPVLPDYFVNGKGYPAGDPAVDPDLYSLDSGYQIMEFNKAGTDWYHELFKPAFSQSHTVSASGANDKNKYFFSLGYLDQQGTYVNTYLKRFTARINTDFGVNNSIHFGENLQIGYTDNTKSNGSIFWTSIATNYLPVYDIKGNWSSLGYPGSGPTTDNPLAMRVLSENDKNYNWQIFGNAFVEISFLKNFRLRSNFGGTLNYNYAYNYSYGAYDTSSGSTSSFTENSGYNSSWTWTNTLAFSKKIATKHSIDVMAGFEEINNYARAVGGTRSGYFTDDPNYRFLSNGDPGRQNNYSSATTSFLQSFFSRLDYSFDEKYLLTATIRRDGSSIFGPENRFGWFPAFSAGWRISQEKFLSQALWLKELKIRASWGETGFYGNTDPLNQYTLYGSSAGTTYYDIYGISSGSVAQGFSTIRIGNPKTGWEKDRVTNIGFESILWNGKLSITADWYTKTSQGLLFQLSLPDILGSAQNVTRPNGNLGNVQNTGIDLLVNSRGKFSSKAGWDLGITFTTYNNKIVKLNDLPFFDYALPLGGQVRNEVGHPMGSFFGYRIIGFFKDSSDVSKSPSQMDAAPGRFKYLDANKDGHISTNDSDMVFIGNPNPKFTLGIQIGMNYKNFDFSTFLYGSFGNDVMNDVRMLTDIYPPALDFPPNASKSKTALYDSWGVNTVNPKAPIQEIATSFSTNDAPNSYALEKGSYLRDKSLMIGFNFPHRWTERIKLNRFRIYVQVTNLFTITKYSGLDPELSGNSQAWGYDGGSNYPNNQKQWLVGVNLNF